MVNLFWRFQTLAKCWYCIMTANAGSGQMGKLEIVNSRSPIGCPCRSRRSCAERGTGQVNKPEIIRGLVDGERKYCRIPIRRKRLPIYAYELEDIMKKYTNKEGFLDIESIQNDATELFQNQNYREAGILCSVIDFIELFSRCTVFTD